MEAFSLINFHQTRDFSRKMNATFEFVKQNFKSLVKSILIIAGPPILIASLLMGSFVGDFFGLGLLNAAGDPAAFQEKFTSINFWMQILVAMIFLMISAVTTIATINNYILLYEEKKSNQIDVNEVWQRVKDTFWMYMGTTFLFVLVGIAAYIVMIIPVVLLAKISPVLVGFSVIILFFVVFYLFISASLVYFIRSYEKKGFFESLARSIKLVQGKWWSTFGLLMILYLIMATISYIPMIPWYAITMVNTFHNLETSSVAEPSSSYQAMTMIFFTLYYLCQMILYSLPNIGIAFQYFNLVERKEASGLISQIGSIGETPTTSSAADEHY